jgi:hypothetical protein
VEFEVDRRTHGCSGSIPDAGSHWIKEVRNVLRKNRSDRNTSIQLESLRGKIGLVAKSLGHLQYASFRFFTDARSIVQRAVHGANRDLQSFSNIFDSGISRLHYVTYMFTLKDIPDSLTQKGFCE